MAKLGAQSRQLAIVVVGDLFRFFFGGGVKLLLAQLTAVVGVGAFTFIVALAFWYVIKLVMGLRVSREEELRGLDIGEHGMEAYAGFQIFLNQ